MDYDNVVLNRTLNLILLLDRSISMRGAKLAQVNHAIPVLKKELTKLAADKHVSLKLRIIAFDDEIEWKVGSVQAGADIENVVWEDLCDQGSTATHKAIAAVNAVLSDLSHLGEQPLPPVVVLVTDGFCNPNSHTDYLKEIEKLKKKLMSSTSSREKVIRVAIGVDDYKRGELEEFATEGFVDDVVQPLVFEVDNASKLCAVINWTSVTSLTASINSKGEQIPDFGDSDDLEEFIDPEDDII